MSDPAKLRLVRTLELDGSYVAARLVGSVVRIVAGSQIPAALPFVQPTDGSAEAIAAAERKNEAVVARSKVGNLLPSYRIKRAGAKAGRRGRSSSAAAPPGGVLRARDADGSHRRPGQGAAAGRLGGGDDRRPHRLCLAGEPVRRDRALGRPARSNTPTKPESGVRTEIHKFDIEPGEDQYRGSGTVSGYLLSQWSLSEHRGILRVVSTESRPGGARAARPSRS